MTGHGTNLQVLFCYDGSEHANRALHDGARLFAGSRATVVNVWRLGFESVPLAGGAPVPPPPEMNQAAREGAEQLAGEGAQILDKAGIPAEPVAVGGEQRISDAIIQVAHDVRADAIVVGSHGRGTISRLLLGSVSAELVHTADCPVLVVPDTADSD